ncbi:MAG: RDD family protein [Candidatus Bathyarchaeota archaeon]|nr:RDD family protein [Candidatus Bathyarchaeota archaeon]
MPYCRKCGNELTAQDMFCPKCGTSVAPEQATAAAPRGSDAPVASGLKLAFWGERFVAWLIDAILISVVLSILGLFSWLAVGHFVWWSDWPVWVPFFNVSGVLYFFYWFFMDASYGQSVGKRAMRLRVVRVDGGRITTGQAALETVGKAFLLPIDALLGWILYPKSRQRLFNHIAETVVVREITA